MKKIAFLFALLLMAVTTQAQRDSVVTMSNDMTLKADRPVHLLTNMSHLRDTLETWGFHLSMGGGFIGSRYNSATAFGITPSIVYRPTDKFTFRTSATFVNSYTLAPYGYQIHGRRPRSMAPYRDPSAMATSFYLSATYQVNDRLWIAGRVMFMGGTLASGAIVNPWFPADIPIALNATAVTAAMRYKLGEDSFLDFHFTYINDRTGALGPLLFGAPYGTPEYYYNTTFGGHLFQ